MHWKIQTITLPLKYTWKISRNATDEKTNFIISCGDHYYSGKGEAAPNIRYGETPELLLQEFESFSRSADQPIESAEELNELFERLNISYALRFAITSAWTHFRFKGNRKALIQEFRLPFKDQVPISYTVPIMDPGQLKKFFQEQQLQRFPLIKLKINRELAFDLTRQLSIIGNQNILLDANEAFTDVEDCIRFLEQCKNFPIELVEQPLPSSMKEEATYMKRYSPFPVFADESITHQPDMDYIINSYHGINMKLMKAGGYMEGKRILTEAKKAGMKTMIGCMVETTLGISSALHLCGLADYADLDSFLLIQNEPYHLLQEKEGILSYANANSIH